MKKYLNIFLLISIFFYSVCLCGQAGKIPELTSKSKKAVKHYEKGAYLYSAKQLDEAKKELNDAIDIDPAFIEAWLLLGDVQTDQKLYDEAIKAYLKAIEINDKFFVNAYFLVANLQLRTGRYAEARENYIKYRESGRLRPEREDLVNKRLESCDFGIHAIANPVLFEPKNMGDSVNSVYDDFINSITADDQLLYLTVQHPVDSANPRSLIVEDFYQCFKLPTGRWSKAHLLGPPVNTDKNEGALFISPDGMNLYFAGCNRSDGFGSCDLYHAARLGQSWSAPENMGIAVNTGQWDSQPSVSSDGKTLYFSSLRPGGYGSYDIWKVTLGEDGKWGNPENLGKQINTAQSEQCPYIHPDGRTLYFTSSGHPGMGGYDLFMSRLDDSGQWSEPVNLGYPINTYADEVNLVVSAKGDLAYLSSNKKGGVGKKDIYSFVLYDAIRPTNVSYLKGKVYDSESHKPLEADFELIDLNSGKPVVVSHSDPVSGEFLLTLTSNHDYALHVNHLKYLFYSETFSFLGLHSIDKPFIKDIPMKKIQIGESVVLKNIFFESGKAELLARSDIELDRLITLLHNNPTMKISIQGHTDNVGTDAYNQALSDNRAKVVYEYLLAKGITKVRLSYLGFGKTRPIAGNDTDEGRGQNRRTEFVVIEN